MALQKANREENKKLCTIEKVPTDILSCILERLEFVDMVRAKAVCRSWNSLLGAEIVVSQMPLLILGEGDRDIEVEARDDRPRFGTEINENINIYNGFLKLGATTQVNRMKRITKEFRECCCIGSSKGWLVFLGKKAAVFLFHPFRQIKIQLPSFTSVVLDDEVYRNHVKFYETLKGAKEAYQIRWEFIKKAILMKEPDRNSKNYCVILLCRNKILYHKSGQSWWTEVVSYTSYDLQSYVDINISSGGEGEGHRYLLALSRNGDNIDRWYFEEEEEGGCIRRGESICPRISTLSRSIDSLCQTYSWHRRFYLVESCGVMLLVARLISDMGHATERYETSLFQVYGLDDDGEWVEVECLGDDRALFLGVNQSASVPVSDFPNCYGNSIYYSDDDWRFDWRLDEYEDFFYGGHDAGVYNYNLKKRKGGDADDAASARPIYYHYKPYKPLVHPKPCWIIPYPKA